MNPSRLKLTKEWALAAMTAALALYYVVVLRWLEHRSTLPEAQLSIEWQRLSQRSVETKSDGSPNLASLTNRLNTLRSALESIDRSLLRAREITRLEPEIMAELDSTFQLFEFENARQSRAESLTKLAREKGVMLATNVLDGLPRYAPEIEDPSILWPRLSIATFVFKTALLAQIQNLNAFEANIGLTSIQQPTSSPAPEELPVRLSVRGPMNSMITLLSSLPLTEAELRSIGSSNSPPGKPAIFIKHLLIKRQTGEKPEEVEMDLTLVGVLFPKT